MEQGNGRIMKILLYILITLCLAACSPKVTTPVIKRGIVISVGDTVVNNRKLLLIQYYTDELQPDFKILYPVESLKPGAVFDYIEDK